MRKALLLAAPAVLTLLAGCSSGHDVQAALPSSVIGGIVRGGQQPVSGAAVRLFQVGTGGYGVGATQLGSTVLSDAQGGFNITSTYNCNNAASGPGTLVYLTATGGDPGGGVNGQLAMMTVLGPCNALTPGTIIGINEVTTVAAAYALGQFLSPTGVGSYGYSPSGLANAFQTAGMIVDSSSGSARAVTPSGTGLVPQSKINTLANILAACINSSSVAGSPSGTCNLLFSAATPSGGVAPADTLLAARNIALNPGNNVAALYALSAAAPPFAPTLSTPPNDWTLAVSYAGGGISAYSIALDQAGFVWTANYAHGPSGLGSVTKLSPQGFPASGSPFTLGIVGPRALAHDNSGAIWVANYDSSQVIGLAGNGNTVSGPYQYSETSSPGAVAISGSNNIWVANTGGNSLTELPGGGGGGSQTISPSGGFTGGGLNAPSALAFDGGNNILVINSGASSVSKFSPAGVALSPSSGFTGGGLSAPTGVAIDHSNNVWVTNSGNSSLTELDPNGAFLSPSTGFTGGGLNTPSAVAIDGGGRVWAVNRVTSTLSLFNPTGTALSPSSGFQGGNLSGPGSIAIDTSGNVWIGNQSPQQINSQIQTITEFIGAAVPSVTPLATAVQTGQIAARPGTPLPVGVQTTVLPIYTVGAAYLAQLQGFGGNSGSFNWSLNSGSLPGGLTLASSGLISGTPTGSGSFPFTVQVCDAAAATNCAISGTLTLSSSNSLPAGGNEALLNGSYVVRLNGFNNFLVPGSGFANGFSTLAVLSLDGAGNVTSGEFDVNNPGFSTSTGQPVTGFYNLNSDRRGTIIIQTAGVTIQYAIAAGSLNGSSIAQELRMIEFDDTRANGNQASGLAAAVGKLQTSTTFSFNRSFVFGLEGETPCSNFNGNGCPNAAFTPFGPISAVGRFTGDSAGNIVSGQQDATGYNTTYAGITLTGVYTAPDSAGRGTLTLNPVGTLYPLPPSHFVYYVISPTEIFLQSSDIHRNFTLLSGDVLAQTSTFTSASTLAGNYLAYLASPANGNGTSFFPDQTVGDLLLLTANGNQISLLEDRNRAGAVRVARTSGPINYTIDSGGRMTVAVQGGGSGPVFYLANTSQAFATLPGDKNDAALLLVEQQTGGPFTCASPAGPYTLGMLRPPVPTNVQSGVVVQDGAGNAVVTLDTSTPGGTLNQGSSLNVTCSADTDGVNTATTGRVKFTSSGGNLTVGYRVSPTRTVLLNTNPNTTTPSVFIIDK